VDDEDGDDARGSGDCRDRRDDPGVRVGWDGLAGT
jgi:hypothetical protein